MLFSLYTPHSECLGYEIFRSIHIKKLKIKYVKIYMKEGHSRKWINVILSDKDNLGQKENESSFME